MLRKGRVPVAVAIALGFTVFATVRRDVWIGHRAELSTDDAYIRAQTILLSSGIAAEVTARLDAGAAPGQ